MKRFSCTTDYFCIKVLVSNTLVFKQWKHSFSPTKIGSQNTDKCTSKHDSAPRSLWQCCELVCVFVWDNSNPLMPDSDLLCAFCCIISLLTSSKKTLMRTQKSTPLLPALTVSIMELFWRLYLRLIFQPHMQALFHLSLLSSSIACNCSDHQPPRHHLSEEAKLSAQVVLMMFGTHSHWYTQDECGCATCFGTLNVHLVSILQHVPDCKTTNFELHLKNCPFSLNDHDVIVLCYY